MNGNGNGAGTLRMLLKWLLVGLVAIVALRLILKLAGVIVGFALWAIFALGPILLVGWLVLKALRHFSRDADYPTA
jgi:hypothetical protein